MTRLSFLAAIMGFTVAGSALANADGRSELPDCTAKVVIEGDTAQTLDISLVCDRTIALENFHFAERPARQWVKPLDDNIGGGSKTAVIIDSQTGAWKNGRTILSSSESSLFAIHYRFDLRGFAEESQSYDGAIQVGRSVMVNLSHWLAVPKVDGRDAVVALEMQSPSGTPFALALEKHDGTYRILESEIPYAGISVFGQFDRRKLALPGPHTLSGTEASNTAPAGTIDLIQMDQPLKTRPDQIAAWVKDTALSVAQYWRGFPVDHAMVVILPVSNRPGVPYGRVIADGGATVLILVNDQAESRSLYEEWVLVHELIHLGSPYMRDTGAWFNEGAATYIEPIVRARAGWKSEEAVWQEWMEFMPRGSRAMGSLGLREGSPYWGGALFLLLVDIEIRKTSQGRLGLEDCLINVLRQGGDIRRTWRTAVTVNLCDAALEQPVMAPLFKRYLDGSTVPVDLSQLWRDLGVERSSNGRIAFNDDAPLATIRRQIVRGGPTSIVNGVPVTQRP